MDNEERNPYLEPENFYAGYNKSMEENKNKPEALQWEKLCFLLFTTEDGKTFMDLVLDRFLIPGFIHPNAPGMRDAAVYYEGFKEAFRMIRNAVNSHKQRIEAESVKA